jgi:hypothetical protein
MHPLKNLLLRSDDVLFVFYDFETTQDTKVSERVQCTSQIWFAFGNSVRRVTIKPIYTKTASVAEGEYIRISMTLSVTFSLISANTDFGVTELWL